MRRADAVFPVLPEGLWIRTGRPEDVEAVAGLERLCFPPAEAAGAERIRERLAEYPDHFWLLFEGDRLVSMADGMVTGQRDLTDDLYADASLHDPRGEWQMLFGVATSPDRRGRGYAGLVLRQAAADAAAQGRKGLVLTCKDALVPYYERFGFVSEGRSEHSCHGNAVWNQMRIIFT